jgi:hypothetical protein
VPVAVIIGVPGAGGGGDPVTVVGVAPATVFDDVRMAPDNGAPIAVDVRATLAVTEAVPVAYDDDVPVEGVVVADEGADAVADDDDVSV